MSGVGGNGFWVGHLLVVTGGSGARAWGLGARAWSLGFCLGPGTSTVFWIKHPYVSGGVTFSAWCPSSVRFKCFSQFL